MSAFRSPAVSETGDPLLLTPGPLTTSRSVKQAMVHDWGSRDAKFVAINNAVRRQLVEIANGVGAYSAVPMQGSGTFSVEAALGTLVPRDDVVLVPDNGAYCARILKILGRLGVEAIALPFGEDAAVDPAAIEAAFVREPRITHVAQVHLATGTSMGATHTVNSSEVDAVEAIRSLTPPPDGTGHKGGADVVIDAVGRPETWKQAFYARDLAGTVVLVGVPTPDMKIPEIPLIDVFGRGGSLKSSWYGDCLPSRDFPMLVDLYQQGRLDLDAFVTEEISIDDVEAAFDKMHGGQVLRSVVTF